MTAQPAYFVTPACGPYGARINLSVEAPESAHRQMAVLSMWRACDKTFQIDGDGEVFHSYEMKTEDIPVGQLLLDHLQVRELQKDDFSLTLRH
ncbi:MAG: hypothetical protein E6R03_00820 [Hyphomicrobiaceae bacterium]|nr:MAG: hypothetical protein E6R03_00820 [Hyphomicrobiaceae bacterium]